GCETSRHVGNPVQVGRGTRIPARRNGESHEGTGTKQESCSQRHGASEALQRFGVVDHLRFKGILEAAGHTPRTVLGHPPESIRSLSEGRKGPARTHGSSGSSRCSV